MPQELSQSTSKTQPTKLKLKGTPSTKPIVEEKKITKEEQVPSKTHKRRGIDGRVIITYKDSAPSYDMSEAGNIHMGLIKRDLHRMHREFLVRQRGLRVKSRLNKKTENKG